MNFFTRILGFAARLVLMLTGLVFIAGLISVTIMLLLAWMMRALWARLTGQPVSPWTFRVDRQAVWNRFYRRHDPDKPAGEPSSDTRVVDADATDVNVITDVVPKRITSSGR